jgi:integrase
VEVQKCTKTPKLRRHKATNQAYVVLNGKAIYFGPYGTPESVENYHRTIAEWHAAGKNPLTAYPDITLNELAARFWVHVENYYRHPDGTPTSEQDSLRYALRPLLKLYGNTGASAFGPRCLRTIQREMVQMGWCRNNVNRSISRIKMLFKWAVSQELLPGSIHQALATVPGLRRGRSEAKETQAVKPVEPAYIEAIEPYVSQQVWAMIQLQLLTAARPGEVLSLRPCDIDQRGPIWFYFPADHKTAHHGLERKIYIGPRGQEILRPFLFRPAEAYCFSPAEAYAEKLTRAYAKRTTPLHYGNVPGSNSKENPEWQPGDHYTVASYRRAIARAIEVAFPAPDQLKQLPDETKIQWQKRLTRKQKTELKAWYKHHHWHPHQLRHNAATFLRKEFGLETARIILGHRSAAMTEVYAEMDQGKAMEAIVRVG